MPPKKAAKQQAAKQKIVEDKTFGLKNKKKSAKVQQYVKNIQQSVLGQALDLSRLKIEAIVRIFAALNGT